MPIIQICLPVGKGLSRPRNVVYITDFYICWYFVLEGCGLFPPRGPVGLGELNILMSKKGNDSVVGSTSVHSAKDAASIPGQHKKHKDKIAKSKGSGNPDNQLESTNITSLHINTLSDTPHKRGKARLQNNKRKQNDNDEQLLVQEKNIESEIMPSMKKLKLVAASAIQKITGRKRKGSNISISTSEKKKKLEKKNETNNVMQQKNNNKADESPCSDDKSVSPPEHSEEINITTTQPKLKIVKDISKGNPKRIQSKKKEKLKQLLQQHNTRTHLVPKENDLRIRMLQKLKAAQFRYLNERLYTSTGDDAQKLFAQDPSAFQAYHSGFQHQIAKWPIKPLECIIERINKMSKNLLIADMGCGDATLSQRVPQKVRSFELVVSAPGVEACNMAHTPLTSASMDVAVYCLALMGTNLTDFLLEANRILKMGGLMIIAEVESRFESIDTFVHEVQRLGFKLTKLDKTHKMFVFFDFKKLQVPPAKKGKLPKITLKPCLYKKR